MDKYSIDDLTTPEDRYRKIAEDVEDLRARLGLSYDVQICAATKTVPAEQINRAVAAGLRRAGENRVNELVEKAPALDPRLTMDFIGTVQTNKLNKLVGKVSLIQSVGSLHAVQEIQRLAAKQNIVQDILVEINSGCEENKSGILPECARDFFDEISAYDRVRPLGVMTVGPIFDDVKKISPFFDKTYAIFLDISSKIVHNIDMPICSMGMSGSWEIAIECGANMIRPGSAIFGHRNYAAQK